MKRTTEARATIAATRPALIESAPSDGPTTSSSRYMIDAGNAPDFRHERQVLSRLRRKATGASGNDSGIGNARVDSRRGLNSFVENDGKHFSDIFFGHTAHPLRAFRIQIETDGGAAVFIARGICALEIAA